MIKIIKKLFKRKKKKRIAKKINKVNRVTNVFFECISKEIQEKNKRIAELEEQLDKDKNLIKIKQLKKDCKMYKEQRDRIREENARLIGRKK